MAIYPKAIVKLVPHRSKIRLTPVRINHHTAVSDAADLYGFFSRPGQVYSHFYINEKGTVYQYQDTAYQAAADLQGNPTTISIETWDGGRPAVTPWNLKQISALVALNTWLVETHGIKLQLASNSDGNSTTSHGFSWHRLGVPHRFNRTGGKYFVTSTPDGWLQRSSHLWYSLVQAKTCPEDLRIAQIPSVLRKTKEQVKKNKEKKEAKEAAKKPTTPKRKHPLIRQSSRVGTYKYIRNLQLDLNDKFPTYSELVADNIWGAKSGAVIKNFKRRYNADVPKSQRLPINTTVDDAVWEALKKYGIKPKKN